MKDYDVIIIGVGPAGIITGVTARKKHPEKTILIIREEDKGLVPCGIPYIFHKLNSVEKNAMGPKPFIDAGGEVVTDPVVDVNFDQKTVSVQSGARYRYQKLVFATGSVPSVPEFIPGYDLENIYYIRKSYSYMEKMFSNLKNHKNIVVIGGGFIGAEVAEQLSYDTSKNISLIESEAYCFTKAFSSELSKKATEALESTHTNVLTSTRVDKIEGKNGKVNKVILDSGKTIDADAVIMAIGYKPNTSLAAKAGLELNRIGAIIVDNYERTPVKDVCAVGDCSQTIGFLTGRMDYIMLASTATAEARVLGHNLFGIKIKKPFTGTLGVFSTEINGLTMAGTGVNETNGADANIELVTAEFSDVDRHPGTLSDTSNLSVKLFVSPSDGSILGGEVWGGKSAGEIINTISLAIQKGVTVYELISYQIGTHPLLTGAPTKNVLIKAAEAVMSKING